MKISTLSQIIDFIVKIAKILMTFQFSSTFDFCNLLTISSDVLYFLFIFEKNMFPIFFLALGSLVEKYCFLFNYFYIYLMLLFSNKKTTILTIKFLIYIDPHSTSIFGFSIIFLLFFFG